MSNGELLGWYPMRLCTDVETLTGSLCLGIWGAVGYASLLVLRQYKPRQFVLATQGLAQCEFSYKGDNCKKKIREMSNAWNQTCRMKRFTVGSMTTPKFYGWWNKRVNDNIPGPSQEGVRLMEEYLLRKILKKDYKKLRLSIKIAGLGKNSEQWHQEIREEKIKADRWERKFQEAQTRNKDFEKSLSESRKEKGELKVRMTKLEKSLHHYQNRNSAVELRASLSKIEEMKRRVEELEVTL
ncbi:hypothetical protein Godav_023636 [Gossypium davidsonii]|uniref:Uncharacterized protein n=1 Tax=Gossypium davidsonii TaxID=34287 RepID=A0A7J8SSW8_GOSDV|nr:hypothetical protein [Gossypium davidsonii]